MGTLEQSSSIEARIERWIKFGVLFFVILVSLWGFYVLRGILLPLLVAFILAYVLNPLVNAMEARAIRRDTAVILLVGGFSLIVLLVAFVTAPRIVDELAALRRTLPPKLVDVKITMNRMEESLAERYPILEGRNLVESLFRAGEEKIHHFGATLPQWLGDHSTTIVMAILIPFFVFFILRDGEQWMQRIFNALPHSSVETVMSLFSEFNTSLGGYIRSLVIDAIVVGAMVAGGLFIIGLNYALLIGIITGIGNFIPYFGPVLGTVVALAAAVFQGGDEMGLMLFGVILVFGAVKLFDDWIFQPLIVGHGAHVHPVLVVISVFIGGYVLGIIGMVIAVPVTVILQVTLQIAFERYRFATDMRRGAPLPPERIII